MTDKNAQTLALSGRQEVDDFLSKLAASPVNGRATGRGRLVFAMDATMSRQPAWDAALSIQADMFTEAGRTGGLDVQLVYYRGLGECRASRWVADPAALARLMSSVELQGGRTQVGRVLRHLQNETGKSCVAAAVFIGDALEEDVDPLCAKAGELGLLGLPIFMFQEGRDSRVEAAYRAIARLSGGAWCQFDAHAPAGLRSLLAAVAAYAAGGRKALADYAERSGGDVAGLLEQIR